jgi:hypothetical protein
MSGDAKEAAVIAAGIKIAHIEIPVICGEDVKVGLHQLPPPEFQSLQQGIYAGPLGQGL